MKTAQLCRMDGPGTSTLTHTVGLQCVFAFKSAKELSPG